MEQLNRVLTFEQGCKYLGYAKSYVYKLIHNKVIPFSKPNGKIYFDRDKLEAWMLGNPIKTNDEIAAEAATYVTLNKRRAAK
jgi:excisionase family DNA binding protein